MNNNNNNKNEKKIKCSIQAEKNHIHTCRNHEKEFARLEN